MQPWAVWKPVTIDPAAFGEPLLLLRILATSFERVTYRGNGERDGPFASSQWLLLIIILTLGERTTCLARISHTNDTSPPTMRRRNKFAVTSLTNIPRVTNDSNRLVNLPSRARSHPTEPERLIVALCAHSAHSSQSEVESGFAGPRNRASGSAGM